MITSLTISDGPAGRNMALNRANTPGQTTTESTEEDFQLAYVFAREIWGKLPWEQAPTGTEVEVKIPNPDTEPQDG